MEERESIFFIWYYSLYYSIKLHVKIKIEMLGVLIDGLIK